MKSLFIICGNKKAKLLIFSFLLLITLSGCSYKDITNYLFDTSENENVNNLTSISYNLIACPKILIPKKTYKEITYEGMKVELFEGKIDTSSIRWVNDCECILTKLNPNNNQEKRPIQIRIISTKGDRYTFEYSLVGDSKNRQRGSIQKIN